MNPDQGQQMTVFGAAQLSCPYSFVEAVRWCFAPPGGPQTNGNVYASASSEA